MKHGSLFSGIGGFDLAAEWMGWENIFHCEWNTFGQKVLNYYWPNAKSYHDITKTDFTIHRGAIDILTGGFPCQPYSAAGKRRGKEDERHLWPEMLRAITEIRPRFIVGENVFGLINWNGGLVFDEVQTNLEAEGYQVFPYVLPACAIDAPHRRDRVWFVATDTASCAKGSSGQGGKIESNWGKNDNKQKSGRFEAKQHNGCVSVLQSIANPNSAGFQTKRAKQQAARIEQHRKLGNWTNWPTQSPVCNGDDGLPTELDGITFSKWRNESIKGGGNAIVPQVALQIFKAIQQFQAT